MLKTITPSPSPSGRGSRATALRTVTLHPSRIGCPSIPGTMKGMILSFKGVREVVIHYQQRSLDVTFDDAETSEQNIIQAIGKEMGLALHTEEHHAGKDRVGIAETCPM